MPSPHILLIGDIPNTNLEEADYLIETISGSGTRRNINRVLRKIDPLLVIRVISNRSVDEAAHNLEEAVAIESYPVIGLHLLNPDTPNLVLTEACNINQLNNAVVCDPTTHDVPDILQWAIRSILPSLAARRLTALADKQSFTDQLLQKHDPRPALKRLSVRPRSDREAQLSRGIDIQSAEKRIKANLLSSTASRVVIEPKVSQEKLDVGLKIPIIDEGMELESFVLGRVGNRYTLVQTTPPRRLRRGIRIPYTTKITISGPENRTVLGYDLSSSGLSLQIPEDLELDTGTEVLLTTKFEVRRQKFNASFELNEEPGYITRRFEQGGIQLAGVAFKVPKFELLDFVEQANKFPELLETLMSAEQKEYERWLRDQDTSFQPVTAPIQAVETPTAICIGELLIDFVSTTTDASLAESTSFTKAPGGAPANVAVGLAKLGVNSGFIGKVGDDAFGEFLRQTLNQNGVDTTHLITGVGCRTTLAFVATRSDGKKDIMFYRHPGADILLEPDEINESYIQPGKLFHYGSVSLSHQPSRDATLRAIRYAKEAGAFTSYDPNLRLMLWDDPKDAKRAIWEVMRYAELVKVADEEWEFVTDTTDLDQGSERILDAGPSLVVVTRGAEGCYYNNGFYKGFVDGFLANVVDSLGAGDGFVAAMLAQLMAAFESGHHPLTLEDTQLRQIMTYANAAGALTTQRVGVIPALPTDSEIESFMASRAKLKEQTAEEPETSERL